MSWLAGASQVVVLARKENDLCSHAEMFEGPKPLLALFDRHPIVVIRMQNQGGRLHILRELQRRAFPVQIHLLKDVAAEIRAVTIGAIARAAVVDEIRNTAKRDCGLEAI